MSADQLADQLLPLLLGNALVATAIAALAFGAQLLRRPTLVHALCALALLKLLTPPLWQVQWWPSEPQVVAPSAETSPPPIRSAAGDDMAAAALPRATSAEPSVTWAQLGCALASLGTLVCLAVAAQRARRFRRLLGVAEPASPELAQRLRRLASHMGVRKPPQLRVVAARISPMLCVVAGSPTVVLPRALLASTSPEQIDTLLAHELAHLRRRDHWLRALELAASAVYWWLPTIWWLRRALRRAEEQCVDAQVLQRLPEHSRSYADALLATLDFLAGRPAMPPIACGAGAFHDLRTRLTTIMTNSPDQPLSRMARLVFLTLAGITLPLTPGAAQDEVRGPDAAREAKLRAQVDQAAKEVADLRDELQALRAELQANRARTQGDQLRYPARGAQRADSVAREAARDEVAARDPIASPAKPPIATEEIAHDAQARAHEALRVAHEEAAKARDIASRAHLHAAEEHARGRITTDEFLAQIRDYSANAAKHAEAVQRHREQVARNVHEEARRADQAAKTYRSRSDAVSESTDDVARVDEARQANREQVVQALRRFADPASETDAGGQDRDADIAALRREMQALQRKLEALQRATEARGVLPSRGAASSGGR